MDVLTINEEVERVPEIFPAVRRVDPEVARIATGPRRLGLNRSTRPGPTLVCVAGVHGNEPAGALALLEVFRKLSPRERVKGTLVGLVGNRRALAAGQRFLCEDLNRAWTAERVQDLREASGPLSAEDLEVRELDHELEEFIAGAEDQVYVLDLHTTSGPGPAFANLDDSLPNRRFALEFPVPLVVGLEERLAGTLTSYLATRGAVTLGFESGQHREVEAVDRAEAAVWIALEAAGILERGSRPEPAAARRRLQEEMGALPHVVEVTYRHAIDSGSGFHMAEGFKSFQPVDRNQILGFDRTGEVLAREAGLLLMPLYQEQGADGFFLVEPIRRTWLEISKTVRRLHLERILHWLPGVRRHDDPPGSFVVNRHVARFLALELFHLLGFRREREDGPLLLMCRRAPANDV